MLNRIIQVSLQRRLLVCVCAVLVGVAGGLVAWRAPVDVLPDLDRPMVTVMSEAPGLSAEEVEQLVTWPVERALSGATGVFRVRSESTAGLSVVYADFEWGADIYHSRQIVGERLAALDLPLGVVPAMAPVSSIMGQILVLGLACRDEATTPLALRAFVDRDLRPRLLAVAGVAQVVTVGARRTELQVAADAARLRAHDVTLRELAAAVRRANPSVVGGRVPKGARAPLLAVRGRLPDAEALAAAVVRDGGARPVRVGDVAEVGYGQARVGVGDAGVDGAPGVLVVVTKQPGVDTIDFTQRLQAEVEAARGRLPAGVELVGSVFRQADFIERAVQNVLHAVRDGAVLVLLVLFAFLTNVRTTLITLTALPLSMACASLVFAAFGLTINTMTLGGLAVAIGTLVDDAIVDVENVYRRLWQNRQSSTPRAVLDVVYAASCEVRRPVTYGTILVTVVYLPLFFLSGIEGRLFAPIGLAYIVSVVASLLVALTVTPVLCALLLGGARQGSEQGGTERYGGPLVAPLRGGADWLAGLGLRWPVHVATVVCAAVLCATGVGVTRGTAFLPPFNEGSAQVNLMLPPGTALATSHEFGGRLERVLMEIEGVAHVARRSGRAEDDEHIMPVSVIEAVLTLDADSAQSREEVLEEIRDTVAVAFPGVDYEVEQPLGHLLSHLLAGVTAQVAVAVRGDDLQVLQQVAGRVEHAIEGIPGVRDLYVEPLVAVEEVAVEPRRTAMAQLGVDAGAVAETVSLAMGGVMLSSLPDGAVNVGITMHVATPSTGDLPALAHALLVRGASGEPVRLADVAALRSVPAPSEIRRENGVRRIMVQHNVAGRALGDVVADVDRALSGLRAELAAQTETSAVALELVGQHRAQRDAQRTILGLSGVSLAIMVLVLQLHFGSLRLALLLLASRPIALIGAVAAVVLTGTDVSIATLVGFIALLGIAARNGILLVDHTVHLLAEEDAPLAPETARRAARERAVPVAMTALSSGIALVPLLLAAGQPGREILHPVAVVIAGGLVTTTLLEFAVMPGLLWWGARDELARLAVRAKG